MTGLVGWKLYRVSDGAELQAWGGTWGQHPGFPNPLFLPSGDHVHAGEPETQYGDYIVRPWMMEEPPPVIPPAPVESADTVAMQAQLDAQGAELTAIKAMLANLAKLASTP